MGSREGKDVRFPGSSFCPMRIQGQGACHRPSCLPGLRLESEQKSGAAGLCVTRAVLGMGNGASRAPGLRPVKSGSSWASCMASCPCFLPAVCSTSPDGKPTPRKQARGIWRMSSVCSTERCPGPQPWQDPEHLRSLPPKARSGPQAGKRGEDAGYLGPRKLQGS